MGKPKVFVLFGFGINCDYETQYAFNVVGAEAERIHFNELAAAPEMLQDYHIFVIPGGFSFGDDIASGKVLANKLRTKVGDALHRFVEQGRLVLGICNGFQVLVKMGLLPNLDGDYSQSATLTYNDSNKFEDRWVYLEVNRRSPCVFTRGIECMYLPVRHGEGKFFVEDEAVLRTLEEEGLVVFRYTDPWGRRAGYPWNPNGSVNNIAGICNRQGTVLGMMPHPEAYNHPTNHPRWTREPVPEEGEGLRIFRNAVRYAERHLM